MALSQHYPIILTKNILLAFDIFNRRQKQFQICEISEISIYFTIWLHEKMWKFLLLIHITYMPIGWKTLLTSCVEVNTVGPTWWSLEEYQCFHWVRSIFKEARCWFHPIIYLNKKEGLFGFRLLASFTLLLARTIVKSFLAPTHHPSSIERTLEKIKAPTK